MEKIKMETEQDKYNIFLQKFNQSLLKCGKQHGEVTLIAVSKTHSADKIRQVYHLGQRHFGENYVQESLQKIELCKDLNIVWHFIGNLQRNKVKNIVSKFALIHSVDSMELAQKISEVAKGLNIVQNCLLQVHIGGEESKGGFEIDELIHQIPNLLALPNISWQGIMSMPPLTQDEEAGRLFLKQTKKFFDQIQIMIPSLSREDWKHLSMGTTHDYEWAIDEGATLIRVGTAIFGEREYSHA